MAGLGSNLKNKTGAKMLTASEFSNLLTTLGAKLDLAMKVKFDPKHSNTQVWNKAVNEASMLPLSDDQRLDLRDWLKLSYPIAKK